MPHCCSWLEFITSVRRLWLPGYGPLDERDAKVAWATYAAMPGEYVGAQTMKPRPQLNGDASHGP